MTNCVGGGAGVAAHSPLLGARLSTPHLLALIIQMEAVIELPVGRDTPQLLINQ